MHFYKLLLKSFILHIINLGETIIINYLKRAINWFSGDPQNSLTEFDTASKQIETWAEHHSQASAGYVRDDQGCPAPSQTASLGIGQRGHLLLQDVLLINKLAAFNRERIPERVVHAKGKIKRIKAK